MGGINRGYIWMDAHVNQTDDLPSLHNIREFSLLASIGILVV